jgi:hypothetical protein
MDLSGIISVSGMGGLFKVTGQLKNGLVAKALADGKNVPIYASHKVSALEDISVFCESDDIPLKDVFEKIKEKENGGATSVDVKKADDKAVVAYFGEVLPDYDRDRVYKSDMKKILTWYNILQAADLLNAVEEEGAEDECKTKIKTRLKAARVATSYRVRKPKAAKLLQYVKQAAGHSTSPQPSSKVEGVFSIIF